MEHITEFENFLNERFQGIPKKMRRDVVMRNDHKEESNVTSKDLDTYKYVYNNPEESEYRKRPFYFSKREISSDEEKQLWDLYYGHDKYPSRPNEPQEPEDSYEKETIIEWVKHSALWAMYHPANADVIIKSRLYRKNKREIAQAFKDKIDEWERGNLKDTFHTRMIEDDNESAIKILLEVGVDIRKWAEENK